MKTRKLILLLLCTTWLSVTYVIAQLPADVAAVIEKAGKNRRELKNAVDYFSAKADSMQLKALFFLIANMDIHSSSDFYWADSTGARLAYSEFNYAGFDSATLALSELRTRKGKLKAVPLLYRDIDTIKAAMLIENIEQAFAVWRSGRAKHYSFNDFCEYILPYRVSVEPLQQWRTIYRNKFARISDTSAIKNDTQAVAIAGSDVRSWFLNTYGQEERIEPLPRLGPLQLLFRKKGPCEDMSGLATYLLRSQGIPVAADVVPMWGTSFGGHFVNAIIDSNGKSTFFDVSVSQDERVLSREPAKVIRLTYGKQPGVLAAVAGNEPVPEGFLKTYNYKDVTDEYWPVRDVKIPLKAGVEQGKIIYACVFNKMQWRPVWWGRAQSDSVDFTKMTRGVVYQPATYQANGKMVPCGYPVAVGYNNVQVLKPDTLNTREIKIYQQEKYLLFRPDKVYKLYYWDNAWKIVAAQKTTASSENLTFQRVPGNCLLLLVPEYSSGKERPFIIVENNKRVWW